MVPYQPPQDRIPDSTGIGFICVLRSMPYDVVICYHSTSRGDLEDAFITLIRPDEVDPEGDCADAFPSGSSIYESRVPIYLPDRERKVIALREVCLEAGKAYKFKIHFERGRHNEDNPTATIMIDSLTLIPRIELTSVFTGTPTADSRHQEYYQMGCNQSLYNLRYGAFADERCRELENYVSTIIYDGASMCNCNPTGSLSKECESKGGYCHCKPNVIGRQCDQCAAGTYGFGPEVCKACDCNSIGAKDNNCDVIFVFNKSMVNVAAQWVTEKSGNRSVTSKLIARF